MPPDVLNRSSFAACSLPTCATRAACALLALLLAACGTIEPAPATPPLQTAMTDATMQSSPAQIPAEVAPAPPSVVQATPIPPRAPGATTQMLAWADRTRALPSTELSLEITRLIDIPDTQRTPVHDLQLAIALGQTHLASDLPRALAAVQKLLANQTEEARALHPLARLVAARLAEQKRVEDQLDRQNQQLRDQQRRIDQLNERLEAMRAIERSLLAPRSNGGANGHSAPVTRP